MKNIFNTIEVRKPNRNFFDLSHDKKFSCDMGRLVPTYLQEVIPGDKITLKSTQMIRFAPMVSPAMHRIDVYTHFFFVPNRLLWSNWEQFITGGQPTDPEPTFPTVEIVNAKIGSIPDYLGVPTEVDSILKVSAMPFFAYAKIWNDYYRDQNLQNEIDTDLNDGDNTAALTGARLEDLPFRRAWEHDYFTSSLPWAQKGAAATIPIQGTADIVFDPTWDGEGDPVKIATSGANIPNVDLFTNATSQLFGGAVELNIDNSKNLKVDLTTATATTINDLRRAYKLQEWLEKNARGGSRYIETIFSHFGVKSSDARLQRPEYLGGGKSPVTISEVLQTSESVQTPQGNLAGHGINVGQSHEFTRSFEEHGFIIGIMSIMPKPAYQQGIQRHLTKFDKFDYFWPSFAHIGEQEVLNKEIYAQGLGADDQVFGYVPRYAEYRFTPSTVHGDFRKTLSYWHMGRIFDSLPALNEDFIECAPTDRIFAVQNLPLDSEDPNDPIRDFNVLYCHVYNEVSAVRPIPKYGTPEM